MGIYTSYLDKLKTPEDFTAERKLQLTRISSLRKGDILVIAAAVGKPNTSIDQSDLIAIADQLDSLTRTDRLDVILETPGGSGEMTEEIVRLLRRKHAEVNFIVPGIAKSAGTIMVMAGDEILMGSLSSLGPIDAQVARDGKFFSAEAFLEGLEKIKQEADTKQALNRAYIPILQGISPGEIEAARNALKFGKQLAANWLEKYKFQHWVTHSGSGQPVTSAERKARAERVAGELGSHAKWLSHGRSIKIEDLEEMGLKITNYESDEQLNDSIRRYHTLLRMSFENNMFKLYETPTSQIYRYNKSVGPSAVGPTPANRPAFATSAKVDFLCKKCNNKTPIQANFVTGMKVVSPTVSFPTDNKFTCPHCGHVTDLTALRAQIESHSKKPIL